MDSAEDATGLNPDQVVQAKKIALLEFWKTHEGRVEDIGMNWFCEGLQGVALWDGEMFVGRVSGPFLGGVDNRRYRAQNSNSKRWCSEVADGKRYVEEVAREHRATEVRWALSWMADG
jgi:hypothetical protein